MESGISINKYLYLVLSTDIKLKEMVGNNIYPLIAEESSTFPFIIFKRTSISTQYSKDGASNDLVEFSIVVVANKYQDSINIAERVRELLEMKKDQYFNNIHLIGIYEDFSDEAYLQDLTFSTIIKHKN